MNKKIAIISGRYPASSFSSSINHKIYAELHGYTYINCCWPTKAVNPYFNKLFYIQEYIDFFDYLFWIDDDAFFIDFSKKIEEFIPEKDVFFIACQSPKYKDIFTFLSSGQFFIKCSEQAKEFLNEVIHTDLNTIKNWWKPELGFFSNGDQDSIIYNLLTKYPESYYLYDYTKFNSRIDNLKGVEEHSIFILHFTGKKEVKKKDYCWIQHKYSMDASLVRRNFLASYPAIKSRKKNYVLKIFERLFK